MSLTRQHALSRAPQERRRFPGRIQIPGSRPPQEAAHRLQIDNQTRFILSRPKPTGVSKIPAIPNPPSIPPRPTRISTLPDSTFPKSHHPRLHTATRSHRVMPFRYLLSPVSADPVRHGPSRPATPAIEARCINPAGIVRRGFRMANEHNRSKRRLKARLADAPFHAFFVVAVPFGHTKTRHLSRRAARYFIAIFRTLIAARSRGRWPRRVPRTNAFQLFFVLARRGTSIVTRRPGHTDHHHHTPTSPSRCKSRATRGEFCDRADRLPSRSRRPAIFTSRFQFAFAPFVPGGQTYGTEGDTSGTICSVRRATLRATLRASCQSPPSRHLRATFVTTNNRYPLLLVSSV